MTNIGVKQYLDDGANWQAQAVLAFIRGNEEDILYWGGFDTEHGKNSIHVGRFENCREQGYVFSLIVDYNNCLKNVVVYEHRNSDALCIKFFDGNFTNTPTINDIPMEDKYDFDKSFNCGQVKEAYEEIREVFVGCLMGYKMEKDDE